MSAVDQVKSRLDIVDVISGYAQLTKAGRNYKALCPFHNEKTPSFVVFPDTQTWRCFGQCGEGGDVFSFVMKREGYDFREALEHLAKRAGVTLESQTPSKSKEQADREERYYGILKESAAFFYDQLKGSPAEGYLHQRGLTDETAYTFGIGHAPKGWDNLLNHLTDLGFTIEDALAVGVLTQNEDNRIYDRFRERFIIPIRDLRGRVIGFGARALEDGQMPKYLNSPQTVLFDKSVILFGMDEARRSMRELEHVIIVEGYMDVIQAHQAGFKNVVATMGTALTKEHVQQLSKYVNRIILALDADVAGAKATLRGLEVAREVLGDGSTFVMDTNGILRQAGKLRVDIRVLHLPHGKDPDDFIRATPEEWRPQVARAKPLAEYIIDTAVRDLPHDASVTEREKLAHDLLPLLTATEDNMQTRNNIQLLSLRLRLNEKAMLAWANSQTHKASAKQTQVSPIQAATNPKTPPPPTEQKTFSMTRKSRELEQYCIGVMLREPHRMLEANELLYQIEPDKDDRASHPLDKDDFTHHDFRTVFELLHDAYRQDHMEILDFVKARADSAILDTIDDLLPEPLELYARHAAPLYATELENIQAELKKLPIRMVDEFPLRLLTLRRERILREIVNLQFLQNDAQQDQATQDAAAVDHYAIQVAQWMRSKRLVDVMIGTLQAKKAASS